MLNPLVIVFLTFGALCALLVMGWLIARAFRQTREAPRDHFIVKPAVQLGRMPQAGLRRSLEITWGGRGTSDEWYVQIIGGDGQSRGVVHPKALSVDFPWANPSVPPHNFFRALVKDLEPGEPFEYRVHFRGEPVFTAPARAPKDANMPHRFVVTGDIAKWGVDERRIASAIYDVNPDLFVIAGDAVYNNGRLSEYLKLFFPVLNNDVASPGTGAPILRSVLTVLGPGNHCLGRPEPQIAPDLDQYADLFGYFIYWSQPLNGTTSEVAFKSYPDMKGADERKQALLDAAGDRFPRMLNFSFDYGDAHWVFLDSNIYTDWSHDEVREWLEKDLAANKLTWTFVVYHHSAFHSNRHHQDGVRMRLVSDILERHNVDVVFAGHVHTYERTHPLRFKLRDASAQDETSAGAQDEANAEGANDIEARADGAAGEQHESMVLVAGEDSGWVSATGARTGFEGELTIDRVFDGAKNTRPDGIIYIVSGAGGATLHSNYLPDQLLPHTAKVIAFRHSFTVCDLDGKTLTVRQLSASHEELDRLVITK